MDLKTKENASSAESEERTAPRNNARAAYRQHQRKAALCCGCLAAFAVATVFMVVLSASPPPEDGEDKVATGEPQGAGAELPEWIEEDLLPVNEYSRPGTALPEVKGVVVHYVGNPNTTAWQNKNYFAGLAESHATYASSNLIVGLEGEILLCVPLDEVAYCSTVRNYDTISIEVCHPDETGKFSETTMNSLIRLLRYLCVRYGLEREDILRHYDADGKECPMWYVKNPDDWEALRDRVFEDLQDY